LGSDTRGYWSSLRRRSRTKTRPNGPHPRLAVTTPASDRIPRRASAGSGTWQSDAYYGSLGATDGPLIQRACGRAERSQMVQRGLAVPTRRGSRGGAHHPVGWQLDRISRAIAARRFKPLWGNMPRPVEDVTAPTLLVFNLHVVVIDA